eukprot:130407-Rhodomonas_salina.1
MAKNMPARSIPLAICSLDMPSGDRTFEWGETSWQARKRRAQLTRIRRKHRLTRSPVQVRGAARAHPQQDAARRAGVPPRTLARSIERARARGTDSPACARSDLAALRPPSASSLLRSALCTRRAAMRARRQHLLSG